MSMKPVNGKVNFGDYVADVESFEIEDCSAFEVPAAPDNLSVTIDHDTGNVCVVSQKDGEPPEIAFSVSGVLKKGA